MNASGHYTITLSEKELKVVLNALGKQPFEEVYQIIEKIVDSTRSAPQTNVTKATSRKKR